MLLLHRSDPATAAFTLGTIPTGPSIGLSPGLDIAQLYST